MTRTIYLLVNFGGPRDLLEIPSFLEELLLDEDVIRTPYPRFFEKWLFRNVAKKKSKTLIHDYQKIGGASPIYADTEKLAEILSEKLGENVCTFHRYLPQTHKSSLLQLESLAATSIYVLPLFPQFTYATTGSIARFFQRHLSSETIKKLRWIRSYPDDPLFIGAFQKKIRTFLEENRLHEEKTILLFSAHGLPLSFVEEGDPYQDECERSFRALRKGFPNALTKLSFQSKFGKGEWLSPSTEEMCTKILSWHEKREAVVFVPLSFPSDHIETLFEIEYQYLPLIRERKLSAYRCPALNFEPAWIDALFSLFQKEKTLDNEVLIRRFNG